MKGSARLAVLIAIVALVAAGCGTRMHSLLLPNQPPEVELFAQPLGAQSYRLRWVGRDPDGRVDHYLYSLGSPAASERSASWTATPERDHALSFPARAARPARASIEAIEPSVFSVVAVDGVGAKSQPARVAFFDGQIAPHVQVTVPPANPLVRFYVNSTTCFGWEGFAEPDSANHNARIVEYKYFLLTDQTEVTVHTARIFPDSVRRYYAPRGWPGWTSVGGNVTSAVVRNLVPENEYVFVVTCFDDAGNYDPIFSFNTNMIYMRVVYAGAQLPRIGAYNESFLYEQEQGSFDPSKVFDLQVPAGQPLTFNWYAAPTTDRNGNLVGGPIRGYRWALDIADVDDARQGNDAGNSGHWTRWDVTRTSATVGPFSGGETHTLYIEANSNFCEDGEMVSLLPLRLHAVQPTFDKELLIVDDTRLVPDRIVPFSGSCSAPANRPIGNWPTAAELDTFLYAVGGKPWKCYPPATFSTPGIFSGYSFDTVGTNLGNADLAVPLSTLAHYRNVIWLVDAIGSRNNRPGTDPDYAARQTSMRYMNQNRTQNTLAAYVQQGGRVWLVGASATASMMNFNRTINDNSLPIPRTTTFANSANELIPGRFIYDQAHWRSEFKQFKVAGGQIRRYLGRFESAPGTYTTLPAQIQLKTPATDPYPPNRVFVSGAFYQTQFDIEFLSAANEILEDMDPNPHHENFQSTLDTLYKATASTLRPDTGPDAIQSSVMTYYHGADNAPFIVTGFNIWNFRRSNCSELVDFVLQQLWGLPKQVPAAGPIGVGADATGPVGKLARPHQRPAAAAAPGTARRN